jgi:RNA polymerase sigma-70 factor (ECF subfamily)
MDQQQLRETVAAAKHGNAEAYRTLLDAYGPRLFGYFLRATRSHQEAEDLLGELMLRLVQRLATYDERGRFDQWLFRIAANMVRDRIRRIRAAPRSISMSADGREPVPLADMLPADVPSVDAGMLGEETSDRLQKALNRLDETTRQMILLRHIGQLSFKELADLFQCPLGTALARVHRGMRALREYMSDEDGT